jgi:serine/threonine-protein kinase RsbW
MISFRHENHRSAPAAFRSGDWWQEEALSTTAEVPSVIGAVTGAMAKKHYPDKDVFAVRLGLEEALINAVKHGNGGDPSKQVEVRYHVTSERVLVEVQDEGEGFDADGLPDPLAPDNLLRPHGRGLLFMRSFLSWVQFNRTGNGVILCKYRSRPEPP